jgi:hypothetical protein
VTLNLHDDLHARAYLTAARYFLANFPIDMKAHELSAELRKSPADMSPLVNIWYGVSATCLNDDLSIDPAESIKAARGYIEDLAVDFLSF